MMKVLCQSFENMAKNIKENNKRIVMFGAGVIGQITGPAIMKEYNLLDNIDCYIDNDPMKCSKEITIYEKKYRIKSPKILDELKDNVVIFLNISRYSDVISQLYAMECTKDMECYLIPMLCIHNFCMNESFGNGIMCNSPVIPKRINYMWLGKKQIPDRLKYCIDSWYKYCPDYEIVQWNEDNYDINKHPYMIEAYENGGYGFVPDYARLDILFNYGGFYLDTDVELIKNLDYLLYQEAFCGVEKWQVVNFGGCSGAMPGHPMLKVFLEERENIHFIDENGRRNMNTCGFYDTRVLLNLGYVMNGTTQNINGMNIYASDYFHPYDYMSGITNCTNNTFSIHHFNGGWMDEKMKQQNDEAREKYIKLYERCYT